MIQSSSPDSNTVQYVFLYALDVFIYIQKHYKKEMMYPAFSDDTGVPSSCFS